MAVGIRGINKSSLWASWKLVRKLLAKMAFRDVVDYLEFDIDPEIWEKKKVSGTISNPLALISRRGIG